MRANEYIREHGLDKARELVETSPLEKREERTDTKHYKGGLCEFKHTHLDVCIDVNKLKHLIESHDLINELGGLNCVKFKLGLYDSVSVISRLKQAIADVESCL